MSARLPRKALFAAILLLAQPALAQNQSEGFKFLEAVKGDEPKDLQTMEELLNKPGSVVINARSITTGETALHVVVKTGKLDYLAYLLSRGANPNVRDNAGVAPIVLAAGRKRQDMVQKFITYKANVNYASSNGETALIAAVKARDLALIRMLLDAGANPDQADLLAGMSARDYATQDTRAPAVAKELAAAPKQAKRAVAGPKL